jgi:hypothetical protein
MRDIYWSENALVVFLGQISYKLIFKKFPKKRKGIGNEGYMV